VRKLGLDWIGLETRVGETMADFGTGVIGKVRKPAGTAGLCVWSRVVGVRGWMDKQDRWEAGIGWPESLYKKISEGRKMENFVLGCRYEYRHGRGF